MTDANDDETVMRRPGGVKAKILCSVGRHGVNRPDDVVVVRALLNGACPAPTQPARPAHRCDPDMIAAIEAFQARVVGATTVSGRVEPDGAVFHALTGG